MPTGRELAEQALREPMQEHGWSPRAAGWFTRDVDEGYVGVASFAAASKNAAAGTARLVPYIGVRDEQTEAVVARLNARRDGYRQTTTTINVGYVTPSASWCERLITSDNSVAVASELAAVMTVDGLAHLQEVAADPAALLRAVQRSPAYSTAVGRCRFAVLLARHRGTAHAEAFLHQVVTDVAARDDPAAHADRAMAEATRGWLASRG